MEPSKVIQFSDGKSLEIYQDIDPMNPRTEFDNMSTMVCFHNRYSLGDKHDYDCSNVYKTIITRNPGCEILPLYLYDHSGITISNSPFSCPWDSGQIGWMFVSREKIIEEFGDDLRESRDKALSYMKCEVETYDTYLRGEIYGFILRGNVCKTCGGVGENEDSCWGFYGLNPIENGMVDCIDRKYRQELEKSV